MGLTSLMVSRTAKGKPFYSPHATAVSQGGGGGGSDGAIFTATVTETSGGSKTNELVLIPAWLAPTDLGSGEVMRVYDDNGSGAKGTVLANFQIDALSTDLGSNERLAFLPVIVPSLGASATRKLFVEHDATAVPTGTAITVADVLATSMECNVEFDIGGTVYTFNLRDAFGVNSSTFSKTAYQVVAADVGPVRSRWIVSGPPFNGGSAHASGDGIRVYMEVEAWKAGTAAVGGGNPILAIGCHVWAENGDATRSSPAVYLYGYTIKRSTSLSSGTLITSDDTDPDGNVIRYDYPRSAPAATLTATGFTSAGSTQTWSRSAGTWSTDILGATIAGDGGRAVVIARNSGTSIDVYVYKASSSLTSLASGNWTIEGIAQDSGVAVEPRQVWIGQKPTNICLPGNLNSAVSPNSRGVMDRLAAAKLYINNQTTYASVTHSTTDIDFRKASDGSRRPLTFFGGDSSYLGEMACHIDAAGWAAYIGPLPEWAVQSFVKCTAQGRRRIYENAEAFSTWQYLMPRRMSGTPSNGQLGVWPRQDGGVDYNRNGAFVGTTIASPADAFWPFNGDTAHHAAAAYPAYLLSGKLYWLMVMQKQEAWSTAAALNGNYQGTGANKTSMGDLAHGGGSSHFGEHQPRGKAWSTRDLLYATICTPDSIDAKIVNAKAYYTDRIAKTWDAAVNYGPTDVDGFYSGSDNEPQWLRNNRDRASNPYFGTVGLEAPWQVSFVGIMCGLANELGLLDSDGVTFWTWLTKGAKAMSRTDTGLVRDYMATAYEWAVQGDVTITSFPTTWAEAYQHSCWVCADGGIEVYFARTPSGSITLSANTVGSGRTMTFANDYFSNGGSWYVNGLVSEAGSGSGQFIITAVSPDGKTLTGNIVTPFASSTPTASTVRLPGPHPSDYTGDGVDLSATDYGQFFTAWCRLAYDAGILASDMTAAISWMTGRTGYTENHPAFHVATR